MTLRFGSAIGALLCFSGCAHAPLLAEVELDGLTRHPSIAVEDVSDSDGMSDSDGLADELRRTRLFDRVERVAVTNEADLTVRGTIDRTCDRVSTGADFGMVVAMSSLTTGVVGSLGAIPHYLSEDYGFVVLSYALALVAGLGVGIGWTNAEGGRFACTVHSDLTVFRAGRPWRRYSETGDLHLAETPTTSAMIRIVARRLAARLSIDLDEEEAAR